MEIEKEKIEIGMVLRLGVTTSRSIGLQERIVKVLATDGEDFIFIEAITEPECIRSKWEIRRSEWTFLSVDESYQQVVCKNEWPDFLPEK